MRQSNQAGIERIGIEWIGHWTPERQSNQAGIESVVGVPEGPALKARQSNQAGIESQELLEISCVVVPAPIEPSWD